MSRFRRALHQLPATVVFAMLAAGLLLTRPGEWDLGLAVIGGAILLAAAFRALLPTLRVGVLAVRSRWFDTVVLAVLGTAILVLAAVVPRGPKT